VEAVDAGPLHHLLRDGVGQQSGHLLGELGAGRPVRLEADRVDHRVRAAAVGHPADHLGEVVLVLAQVEHLRPARPNSLEPLRHEVHADDAVALVHRDPRGHVADRAEPEDGHAAAVGDRRVVHGLPRGGQHVREIDEALVRRSILRAVQLRVAVQHRAHALVADLRRLALGLKAVVAHEAAPAGHLERHHDAVAGRELRDLRAHLLDDPYGLVAED
jgi:hypothetical protein